MCINLKSIFIFLILISFCILSCTSKNRYEKQETGETLPPPSNKLNLKNDNQAEIESNAIPYLEGFGAQDEWFLKLSFIQNEVFEAQLNFQGKLYIGLLKHSTSENPQNIGEFYVGEVIYNNQKKEVQFYMKTADCTDSKNVLHKARIAMLWEGKEYYGCAKMLL
ncbi:MAG: hypothetical protein IPM48_12365 [Saprospiraceae bacterium]|nr:hypothetical protein [Saprospiraceae bacterium]